MTLRIAYAGTPEFAVPALKSIAFSHHDLVCVITQPDRQSGRGRKLLESPVKKAANSFNLLVKQPENINYEPFMGEIKALELDLMVVAAYGQIFTQALLSIPRLGCINIHASLLPRWRGAAPIQNAILAGDKETGVSIIQMSEAMDAGDVWLQQNTKIESTDTAQSLHDRLAQIGASSILPAINKAQEGKIKPTKQPQNQITYCTKLQKSDGFINWDEENWLILRKIRAFYPWPGTYTTYADRRIVIIDAKIEDTLVPNKPPGTIYNVDKTGIYVVCGKGCIRLETLIPEGGKVVSATDFSNSNQVLNHVLGK